MITEEQFTAHIEQISDEYEAIKDQIYGAFNVAHPATGVLLDMITKFRDTCCIALRESHVTKNFNDN